MNKPMRAAALLIKNEKVHFSAHKPVIVWSSAAVVHCRHCSRARLWIFSAWKERLPLHGGFNFYFLSTWHYIYTVRRKTVSITVGNFRFEQFFRDVVVPVFTLSVNTNIEEGGKIYLVERICKYLILWQLLWKLCRYRASRFNVRSQFLIFSWPKIIRFVWSIYWYLWSVGFCVLKIPILLVNVTVKTSSAKVHLPNDMQIMRELLHRNNHLATSVEMEKSFCFFAGKGLCLIIFTNRVVLWIQNWSIIVRT